MDPEVPPRRDRNEEGTSTGTFIEWIKETIALKGITLDKTEAEIPTEKTQKTYGNSEKTGDKNAFAVLYDNQQENEFRTQFSTTIHINLYSPLKIPKLLFTLYRNKNKYEINRLFG